MCFSCIYCVKDTELHKRMEEAVTNLSVCMVLNPGSTLKFSGTGSLPQANWSEPLGTWPWHHICITAPWGADNCRDRMTSKSGGQGPTRPAPAHWARGRCDLTAVFFLPGLRTESVLLQASTDELRQPGLAQAEGGRGSSRLSNCASWEPASQETGVGIPA